MRKCVLIASLLGAAVPVDAQIRDVTSDDRQLISLQTKLRFTTMIVLPLGEEIVDLIAGDASSWTITSIEHVAHIKPTVADAKTNLNFVTTSGTIYSFLLAESAKGAPDLVVHVLPRPGSSVGRGAKRFYPASHVEALEAEVQSAKTAASAAQVAIQRAKEEADAKTQEALKGVPARMRFVYDVPYRRPFLVRAMWHDLTHTYVVSDAQSLPAIYAEKDGEAAVVDFDVPTSSPATGSTYVVPGVLERGYLQLGKERLRFQARDADVE